MAETLSDNRSASVRRMALGAAFILIGVLGLATLIFISNSHLPAAERAMLDLGLAGSALLSAFAQALVFLGGWMIWSARRSRKRERT